MNIFIKSWRNIPDSPIIKHNRHLPPNIPNNNNKKIRKPRGVYGRLRHKLLAAGVIPQAPQNISDRPFARLPGAIAERNPALEREERLWEKPNSRANTEDRELRVSHRAIGEECVPAEEGHGARCALLDCGHSEALREDNTVPGGEEPSQQLSELFDWFVRLPCCLLSAAGLVLGLPGNVQKYARQLQEILQVHRKSLDIYYLAIVTYVCLE